MKHTDKEPFMLDVSEHDFHNEVIEASRAGPVLVDFWAGWCAPCVALAPHLERVVQEQGGRVRLAKLEVDDNMRVAGHYRVRGFPTVILFRGGEEIARFSGARSSPWLREFLREHLGGEWAA
ncbi:MAG: thioredoxin domain-containing protein [Chromatiales bacterium]|jgi:putative thioredoxin